MILPLGLALTLVTGAVPWVSGWASEQESRILSQGQPLPPADLAFARELQIEDPGGIRYLAAKPIPSPVPEILQELARKAGFPIIIPAGMTLGRGIYILPGHERVLRHELVHVSQYQRLGGISGFMREYLQECMTHGYFDAPLEREARERSEE